ncbi:MAG: hypothetical protein LC803_10465 [Acidobacteria bacterium]|nr:hypothetical protein [Acidobacteriota bacterium]
MTICATEDRTPNQSGVPMMTMSARLSLRQDARPLITFALVGRHPEGDTMIDHPDHFRLDA